MGVKEIIEKIKEEGAAEVKKLESYYESRVSEVSKEQEMEKKAFFDVEMEKIDKEKEEVKRGILLSAKLDKRKKVLKAKRDGITKVLEKVQTGIKDIIGGEKYLDFLTRKASSLCGDGDVIYLSASDMKEFGDKIKKALKAKVELKAGSIKGGMLIERGSYNYNLSVEALIEQYGEELEQKIGKKLNVL